MDLSTELRRDKRAAQRFSSSLMSNTKWRALFGALNKADIDIGPMNVKFTEISGVKTIKHLSLQTPYAFADCSEFGPFPLVGIEWLEFHDVAPIRAMLQATGKHFPLEETPTGLRVIGHRR